MGPEYCSILRKALPTIILQLEIDEVFLSLFRPHDIFEDGTFDDISKKTTPHEMAHTFCLYLLRAKDEAFDVFLGALRQREIGQEHIAEELEDIKEKGAAYNPMDIDVETPAEQKAFFQVLAEQWENIKKELTITHSFLAFFQCMDYIDTVRADTILKGHLDNRVDELWSVIEQKKSMRPSVFLEALKKSSQQHIAQNIEKSWM